MAMMSAPIIAPPKWVETPVSNHRPSSVVDYGAILARRDDRLIVDIGHTREELMGSAAFFWWQWFNIREPWSL